MLRFDQLESVNVEGLTGRRYAFVATRTNLIPSHSCKPLMEAVVDQSLKRSWETPKRQQRAPRFSPPEGVKAPLLSFYLWSATRQLVCSFLENLSLFFFLFHLSLMPSSHCPYVIIIVTVLFDYCDYGSFAASVSQGFG